MDPKLLETVIGEVVREVLKAEAPAPVPAVSKPRERMWSAKPAFVPPASRTPVDAAEVARVKAATPARVAMGRAGTRYVTDVYVQLRAEHAIAVDAVHSEVTPGLPEALGCVLLESRAADLEDFLLFPNHGRRLSDPSRERLEREGTRGSDVVVVVGDGLSAWALNTNGPTLVPALERELRAAGFSVGKPVFVRRARVGVQDEVGTVLGAKATVILVGERPGLGTGDSLSLYTAYNPRLEQDNAEKDCISNIRPLGLSTEDAAKECAALLKRTFQVGGGGVKLTRSGV